MIQHPKKKKQGKFNKFKFVYLLFLFAFCITACEKDNINTPKEELLDSIHPQLEGDFSSIEDPILRNFFDFNYYGKNRSEANSRQHQALIQLFKETYEFKPNSLGSYKKISNLIYKQERESPFLENLIAQDGYPIWHRSMDFAENGDLFYVVPFAKNDESQINSILLVTKGKKGSEHRFHYWRRADLDSLIATGITIEGNHMAAIKLFLLANTWTFRVEENSFTAVKDQFSGTETGRYSCTPVYAEGLEYQYFDCNDFARLNSRCESRWEETGETTTVLIAWDCEEDEEFEQGDSGGGGGSGTSTGSWPGSGGGSSGGGTPVDTQSPEEIVTDALGYYAGYFSASDIDWMASNLGLFNEDILSFLNEYNYSDLAISTTSKVIALSQNDWLNGPYDDSERSQIMQVYEFTNPLYPDEYVDYILHALTLKKKYPNRSDILIAVQAMMRTKLKVAHVGLDICGVIPVAGEFCDFTNGVLYTIEGDGVNAALSYAAMLPLVGTTATVTKYYRFYKVGNKSFNLTFNLGGNLIEFGSRNKLKRLLKPSSNQQAHHIITWANNNHEIIQKAAQAGWHPSHMKNGINLDKSIHNGWDTAHSAYSQKLKNFLDSKIGDYTNPTDAKNFLENIQTSVYNQFMNGKKLDEITFP